MREFPNSFGKIILASTSVHRKKILQQLSIDFAAHAPRVDERQLEKEFNGPHETLAEFLAQKKAESLVKDFPDSPIIGSDQVLLFKNKTLSKPETREEVLHRLSILQGQTHELHTGLCVCYMGKTVATTTVARIGLRPLSAQKIESYYELDHPVGCAGGYKIEAHGPLLCKTIETSDYYSIIGLPVLSLVKMLRDLGIEVL